MKLKTRTTRAVPKITIGIINFNRAEFVGRAIRSCLNQRIEGAPIEIVVVDDGSTDSSVDVIRTFPETRLIRLETNNGVGLASSIALEEARGDFFMRVDSDDFISADSCRILSSILTQAPNFDFAYGDLRKVFDKSGRKETLLLDNSESLYEHGAGVLFRTSTIKKVGGYDRRLRNCEDLDLFLRLEKAGARGIRVPVPLYRYHIHSSNTSLDASRVETRRFIYERYKESHGKN